jgi:hypothetical protein
VDVLDPEDLLVPMPKPSKNLLNSRAAGKRRCRMHGGAAGSGGPKGPRNGNYKHGRYTAETMATRRWLRERIRELKALTRAVRDQR